MTTLSPTLIDDAITNAVPKLVAVRDYLNARIL